MLRNLGRTIEIAEVALRALKRDGLTLFPLAMGGSLLVVLLYVMVAFEYGGTFGRMGNGANVMLADFVLLGLAYLGAAFVIAYFSAALASAVHYRFIGGTPDLRSGLEAANDRLGALVVWSIIGATAGLLFRPLAGAPGAVGRLGQRTCDVFCGWAPFLVLPVLMVEGAHPPAAMQRSSEMYLDTWQREHAARQSFAPLYVGYLITVILLGIGAAVFGASVAVVVVGSSLAAAMGVSVLKCVEALFVTALYQYAAVGDVTGDFPEEWLCDAFGYGTNGNRRPRSATSHRAAA